MVQKSFYRILFLYTYFLVPKTIWHVLFWGKKSENGLVNWFLGHPVTYDL